MGVCQLSWSSPCTLLRQWGYYRDKQVQKHRSQILQELRLYIGNSNKTGYKKTGKDAQKVKFAHRRKRDWRLLLESWFSRWAHIWSNPSCSPGGDTQRIYKSRIQPWVLRYIIRTLMWARQELWHLLFQAMLVFIFKMSAIVSFYPMRKLRFKYAIPIIW